MMTSAVSAFFVLCGLRSVTALSEAVGKQKFRNKKLWKNFSDDT